jgi:hypothetical protein
MWESSNLTDRQGRHGWVTAAIFRHRLEYGHPVASTHGTVCEVADSYTICRGKVQKQDLSPSVVT